MEHAVENFQLENGTTFSEVLLFPEIFHWNEPKNHVLFTTQPEFPESLGKWKTPLEVLYAANQLGLNAPDSFAWFNTIPYVGKRGCENQRKMKPGNLQLKTITSRLKYFISSEKSDEKSVHLQVLQILHILCFTDVNSETETHFFFLVMFLNSTSEYMNQKRQVF